MTTLEHAPPAAGAHGKKAMPVGLLGATLFIASEIMFFGGLFGTYFTLRADAPEWPPAGVEAPDGRYAAVLTAILVTSSITMQIAVVAAKRDKHRLLIAMLGATLTLGALFLGGQLREWLDLGFSVSSHTYGSVFFTLTGFHGFHVIGGAIYIFLVFAGALRGGFRHGEHMQVEAASFYWHFVDVIWLFVFSVIYLIK